MWGDPRWVKAKYAGECSNEECGHKPFRRGGQVLYYPRTRAVVCEECGEREWAQFQEAAQDERAFR
ncbi:MAG: YgiT-type zinc finger protein [Christensenellales bacterium]|jgi:YgiT-type zinc finger domain-containing protein